MVSHSEVSWVMAGLEMEKTLGTEVVRIKPLQIA